MSLKDLIEVIKGGFNLEFKSDEGKTNCGVISAIVVIICSYIWCQTKIAVAYITNLHKPYGILSLKCYLMIVGASFTACFILMCLSYCIKRKIDKIIDEKSC